MKKAILILMLISGTINMSGAINVEKMISNIADLLRTLTDEKTGLINNVDNLKKSADTIKIFAYCSRFKGPERKNKVAKMTSKGITTSVKCNDISELIEAMIPILHLWQHNIIGSEEKPGILYTILNLFENAGITSLRDIKTIISSLSKIIGMTTKLMGVMEDKVVVKDLVPVKTVYH